ncbi:hypothetical protein LCGC14_3065010 [marine sediment metagenome]|uniref:Uncharacterized protein n=1 Tax=marine sediment metagenome TaxID=412755 RepID=A0A0F8WHT3_9ZZZZ
MDKILENKIMRIKGDQTLKMLCQNKKQWHGVTVFTFDFNGTKIDFVTLKDAQVIKRKCIEETLKHKKEARGR